MLRDDFVWGVATSSYQIEGKDDKIPQGECVWDTFIKKEGSIFGGHNADVACDELHQYKKDIPMMANLGIKAYRFSLNWARILPNGVGEVNEEGIKYYRDVLKLLNKHNIKPYITLFHWEYPQVLFDKGGWLNPDCVEWFGEYAKVVAENFSDLCTDFFTINEPQCVIYLGHTMGIHAPGVKMPIRETLQMAHNLLKCHGMAVKMLRRYSKTDIKIGYAPTCGVAYPATDDSKDVEVARRVYFGFENPLENWGWNVSWFLDPVVFGKYPEEGIEKFKDYLPKISEEQMKKDLELINQPIDFIGQNIYNGYEVRAVDDGKDGKYFEYVDRYVGFPKTSIQWPITPRAFYYGIKFLSEKYKLPLYITENGMACHDNISYDGKVHDPNRITFLDSYISAMQQASDDGANIVGYFLWSIIDNFEWANGFDERFGLVYIDYRNQKRIVKDSGFWYKKVIETNGKSLNINNKSQEIVIEDLLERYKEIYSDVLDNATDFLEKIIEQEVPDKKARRAKLNQEFIDKNMELFSDGTCFIVLDGDAILESGILFPGAKVMIPEDIQSIKILGECKVAFI